MKEESKIGAVWFEFYTVENMEKLSYYLGIHK